RRVDERPGGAVLGRRAHHDDAGGGYCGARGPRARPEDPRRKFPAHEAVHLLRYRHPADVHCGALAGHACRASALPGILMASFVGSLFASWLSEVATLAWLGLALAGAIVEVSIPHFGFAFVSAASVAAAVAAYFGFGIIPQIGIFVVVLAASLVGLRSRLVGYLGGQGVPSRTAPLVGKPGVVTHEIDATLGSGRVNVGGEDWAARATEPISTGVKIRVVGADGIVLEVTRA